MTNEQLVVLIQNHIDEAENMLQLWQQCKDFISMRAKRLVSQAELADLEQEGFIGLCNAVGHYDHAPGVPFINYAVLWIDQAMKRYIDNCCGVVRVSTHVKYKALKAKKLRAEFVMRYGRTPSDAEERRLLAIGKEEHETIKQALKMGNIASLDAVIGGEDEDITLADMVPGAGDLEAETVESIYQEQLSSVLWGIVDELPGTQAELLHCIYENGLTIPDASERLGMQGNAGVNEHRKALTVLRRPGNKAKLRPFISDEAIGAAYKGSVAGFHRTRTSPTERAVLLELGER